jgi:hypothetical protein
MTCEFNFTLLENYKMKIRPWTMILTMLAGWINQHQQDLVECYSIQVVI